jgi:hypothetical protein
MQDSIHNRKRGPFKKKAFSGYRCRTAAQPVDRKKMQKSRWFKKRKFGELVVKAPHQCAETGPRIEPLSLSRLERNEALGALSSVGRQSHQHRQDARRCLSEAPVDPVHRAAEYCSQSEITCSGALIMHSVLQSPA